VNAPSLLQDFRARGVTLEAQGEFLKVDAPAGELTEADKAALIDAKPKLLELLSFPQDGAPERESVARWAGPRIIEIRDPFTGVWHRWPASECLPGVVAEADRLRNITRRSSKP
jgi:hypothetical protein